MNGPYPSADLPPELKETEAEPAGQGQLVLTPEERRAYLGKLADFEVKLAQCTDKQAAFVLEVLRDPTNYERAARVAGYKFASIESVRLRNNPLIASLIALGEQIREDRTLITSDRTLHEFALIAYSDIRDYRVNNKGELVLRDGAPEYAARAVSSIEWDQDHWVDDEGKEHTKTKTKIKLWSKVDALKMLAMYQKLLSGDGGVNLHVHRDNHVHLHQHQHNTWQFGDEKLTF